MIYGTTQANSEHPYLHFHIRLSPPDPQTELLGRLAVLQTLPGRGSTLCYYFTKFEINLTCRHGKRFYGELKGQPRVFKTSQSVGYTSQLEVLGS